MIEEDTAIKVKEATKKLSQYKDITPQKIDRESYEYKLAFYYYWLYQNERHDHNITKQELVAAEGAVEEYANAFHGQDRQGLTAQKIADQIVNGIVAACTEIDNIARPSKFQNLFKITWPFVVLFLGGIFIWQLAANNDFRQAITNPIILLIVAGVAVVLYLWRQQK